MNILEAMAKLQDGTARSIYRKGQSREWGIHMYEGDTWKNFQKCRTALEVRDLIATDWMTR